MIIPKEDKPNGKIAVYLVAETQNYDATIISASIVNGPNLKITGNVIEDVNFIKDHPIRMKVVIDYNDMCALEVKTYATSN